MTLESIEPETAKKKKTANKLYYEAMQLNRIIETTVATVQTYQA